MGAKSVTTHEFRCGEVLADGSCLYTSVLYVNGTLNSMDSERLRAFVVDYIRKNTGLHDVVLNTGINCKSVDDYCDQVEKCNLRGGEPELRALNVLCRILICLVSKTKNAEGKFVINTLYYGEDNLSLTECVYIFYDEENKHYTPLYVIGKENSTEEITIFRRDDETVDGLLQNFIQAELQDDTLGGSDCDNPAYETELFTESDLSDKNEELYELIASNRNGSSSNKRQIQYFEDQLSPPKKNKPLPTSISNEYYDHTKPTKFAKFATSQTAAFDESSSGSMTIDQLLQIDLLDNEFVIQNEEVVEDVPMTSNAEQRMRLEIEPILKFRGRTSHEYKPMKALNRKGQPSKPQSPRYFADQEGNHYLNLLIPEKYLSPAPVQHRLEICLVTEEINGNTYYQPYFKLQVHQTDKQIPDENPMFIYFDNENKLENYSEGIKQLKLYLVVIMHKNDELMQSEQPLKVFSSSNHAGSAITTKFDSPDAFKTAYHLQNLRFAITLWSKGPGEEDFHRHDDIQCISSVSSEDKTTRVERNHTSKKKL